MPEPELWPIVTVEPTMIAPAALSAGTGPWMLGHSDNRSRNLFLGRPRGGPAGDTVDAVDLPRSEAVRLRAEPLDEMTAVAIRTLTGCCLTMSVLALATAITHLTGTSKPHPAVRAGLTFVASLSLARAYG